MLTYLPQPKCIRINALTYRKCISGKPTPLRTSGNVNMGTIIRLYLVDHECTLVLLMCGFPRETVAHNQNISVFNFPRTNDIYRTIVESMETLAVPSNVVTLNKRPCFSWNIDVGSTAVWRQTDFETSAWCRANIGPIAYSLFAGLYNTIFLQCNTDLR